MKFRIKEARKMSGMTQKELAARLDVSVSTLSEYESGKYDPRSDVLCEIADIVVLVLISCFAALLRAQSLLG